MEPQVNNDVTEEIKDPAQASAGAPEPEAPKKPALTINVTLGHPIIEALKRDTEIPVFLLRVNSEERERFEARNPRDDNGFINDGGSESEWSSAYQIGVDAEPSNGFGIRALNREGSQWGQGFELNGQRIVGGSPEIGANEGTKLTGKKAVMHMRAQMGLGATVTYPLYGSGIWLMLKPPMDDDLLDFDVANSLKRIQLGRATYGLIFSNQAVMQDGDLWDFIMRHVINCNVEDWTPELLADLILSTDFQALVTYFASTIYPNGYTVSIPCTTDTTKCTYVAKGHLNVGKMVVDDTSMLTMEHKRFLADRFKKRTVDEIRAYQSTGPWAKEEVIEHNGMKLSLKVPTMSEYLTSGRVWIDDIITRVENLLGTKGSEKEKSALMTRHSLAALLRYYGHFVKQIETDQAIINYTESPAEMNEMLDILSADVELSEKIFTDTSAFIENRTVTMACVPAWPCPECGDKHVDPERKHPYLVPINASVLFFALKDRKLLRV